MIDETTILEEQNDYIEALPCPFCLEQKGIIVETTNAPNDSGEKEYPEEPTWWYCVCISCTCQGPSEINELEAVNTWNKRPTVRNSTAIPINKGNHDGMVREIVNLQEILSQKNNKILAFERRLKRYEQELTKKKGAG
jgi:hypothetical protein